jgi:hypothetical protein
MSQDNFDSATPTPVAAETTKLQAQVDGLQLTVDFLSMQVQNLYLRLQLEPLNVTKTTDVKTNRGETGMGPILNTGASPYL